MSWKKMGFVGVLAKLSYLGPGRHTVFPVPKPRFSPATDIRPVSIWLFPQPHERCTFRWETSEKQEKRKKNGPNVFI